MVYLGIGSNIDAAHNIDKAKAALKQLFKMVRFSRTFESEAIGFSGDNFLNLVAEVDTQVSLELLIEQLKTLEDSLGRVRGGAKFSSRHIDIDILLYGDTKCESPIILPRAEIRDNAYVLWPLAELAPLLVEPGGGETYGQLWRAFKKNSQKLTPVD